MPAIAASTVTIFYLFEIADQVDLVALRAAIGAGAAAARFQPKSAAPDYVQYAAPPVVVDGEDLGVADIDGFRPRIKFFDYGVLSLALSKPFAGDWPQFIALSQLYVENDDLERCAADVCREVAERFAPLMQGRRTTFLAEDYLVFCVNALDDSTTTADELMARRGEEIALLLRGEKHALSQQEQTELLRNRLSYLADDLVIPTWNTAFVYDTETGSHAALEIFEFANSQLLEFRHYDDLLDTQLGRIYTTLQHPRWYDGITGRGYIRAARELHSLFIDVNELTDRTENALKMVGDIYAARLFNLTAARLGLARWKESVHEKLKTLDDIYRFAVEQVAISRGYLLELTIILILVVELVLFFLGIMR